MSFQSKVLFALALALALALPAAPAYAELYGNYCFGSPDKLDTNGLNETQNTYSIPPGSGQERGYLDAVKEWNLVSAMPVYASYVENDTTINHGDWDNEVALVNPSTISPNLGFTVYAHANFCAEPGHGGNYSESDTMVSNVLNFARPDWQQGVDINGVGGGRQTFLHEMGHQLGLGHFGSFNVMNTQAVHPLSAALETPFSPFGGDVSPLIKLYGQKGNINLIASAQNEGPNFTVVRNLPAGDLFFCPQTPATIRMTVGNLGAAARTFNQRVRLIRDDRAFNFDLIVWNGGTVNPHNGFTWVVNVNLANVPAGIYLVEHYVDHDRLHQEWEEDDNAVVQSSRFVMFPREWCGG